MNLDSRIEFCKQLAIRETVQYLQPILNKPFDEVLREFMISKTYDLLQNTATRMWAESGGYIGNWYLEEKHNTLELLEVREPNAKKGGTA